MISIFFTFLVELYYDFFVNKRYKITVFLHNIGKISHILKILSFPYLNTAIHITKNLLIILWLHCYKETMKEELWALKQYGPLKTGAAFK